jgi:tetratricopeptide (TPR) repeat protein
MKKNASNRPLLPEKKNTADTPAPVINPTPEPASTEPGKRLFTEDTLKKIFLASLIVMGLITLISGFNVGFNSDEIELNNYGKANLAYYMSAGKDTTLNAPYYKLLKYYGNAYEMVAATTNKVLGTDKGRHEFNVRHSISQLFAIAGLLFTGLTARKLTKTWSSSIFAVWLLFLTPSFMGHFLFNTRDVPFYAGYVASIYYIICFLEELPAPTWKTSISLLLAAAFTTNIRIGGVLLYFYLGLFGLVYLFSNKELMAASLKNAKDIIIKLLAIIPGGILLVILTWPTLLKKPSELFDALGVASKFPIKVNVNFEGVAMDSLHLPIHYIPKYMMVTIPLFVIACIVAGTVLFFTTIKKYDPRIGALLLFAVFFPVVYAVYANTPLYSSWRHFLFVFPGLCIFGAIALDRLFSASTKLPVNLAIGAVCILAVIRPVAFCVRNTPFEYCYFNELAGEFKTAYLSYDNDYWEISVKQGIDWLMANEHPGSGKDTTFVATNASAFAEYYLAHNYPKAKIKVVQSGFTMRNSNFWTYAVFNSLFLKPEYLENYFPPPHLHAITIDHIPVTTILKDTVRLDWKANVALRNAQHALSDSLYREYIKTTKDDNIGLYAYMAVAKGSMNLNDEAIVLANKALEYHLSPLIDYNAYCGLGIAYANKKQWQISIENLRKATAVMPKEIAAPDILRQVMAAKQMSGQ